MKKESFYKNLDANSKYILLCCFFIFAVNGLFGMILGSLLPLISEEYALSNTVSGSLLSAHQAGNLLAGFIAGILPFYMGKKQAILFLCCFVIAGFAIMIFTGNPVLLIIGFLFTGISRGSISNFNNATVNEIANSSPAALNLLHSMFAIGALSAPFLVIFCTNLAGNTGWKWAAGTIMFLAALSILLFSCMKIKNTPVKKEKKAMSYAFLKNKYFIINAGILFFYLCAEATINGWIVKYFVDAEIMTTQYAQMLAALLWVVILAGRLTCMLLSSRISKKTLLLMTATGTTAFYILLLSTQNIQWITFAIAGLGFSMAGIYPTTIANIGNVMRTFPMAIGVLLILGGAGAIIMPIITGILADISGIFAGMTAIVAALVLMLVCAVINLLQKENTKDETQTRK